MEPLIGCTLTDPEKRERRQMILDSVRTAVLNVKPLPQGYAYYFEPTPELIAQIERLVELERQCCPFLTFRIVGNPPTRLEVTGPAEAKALIADFFGSSPSS